VAWLTAFAVVCVCLLTFEFVAGRVAFARFKPPGDLIAVGGRRVHVRRAGDDGPSVVFESGAGSSSAAWLSVQPDVALSARTLSYDRAGFGWSDASDAPPSLKVWADDLHAVLSAAQFPPPYVLVAHSLGGAIATQFAADHPDLVAGYVFVDAAYAELYETFVETFPWWLRRLRRTRIVMAIAHVLAYLGVVRLTRFPVASKQLPPAERKALDAVSRSPRFIATVRREFAGLLDSRDAPKPAFSTQRPARVLSHGKPNALFKEQEAEALWTQMQTDLAARFGVDVDVVPETGHFIQLDAPRSVIAAVRSVCGKRDPRS
jgi:pimeloyl-ACP methyl ester carboxylesterase